MEVHSPVPQLICHQLESVQQDPEIFKQVYQLSRTVFDPDTPDDQLPIHHRQERWEEEIAFPNSSIFYVTNDVSETPGQPIGFFFALPRVQPEIGYELLHIRLAAVTTSSRGLGVFPLLMLKVTEHARNCGYKEMVNTHISKASHI
jgi:GNAT superfamily N-acetyltransferase